MNLCKIGECVEYDDITYTVGDWVIADKSSDYSRLVGVITQITDENGDLDIYCDFLEPTDPDIIKRLEARFSHIYNDLRTLQDIPLDDVVMAPDELQDWMGRPPCCDPVSDATGSLCKGKRLRPCYSCGWDIRNEKIREERNHEKR